MIELNGVPLVYAWSAQLAVVLAGFTWWWFKLGPGSRDWKQKKKPSS